MQVTISLVSGTRSVDGDDKDLMRDKGKKSV